MMIHRAAIRLLFALLLALSLGVASEATATSIFFLDGGPLDVGFDTTTPGFPTEVDAILPPNGPFVDASTRFFLPDPVRYSLDHCLLVAGGSECRSSVGLGRAYTDVVTLTLESVEGGLPQGGIVLFLSGLSTPPNYDFDDASIELDPTNPDFAFDPLLHFTLSVAGDTFHYFGFEFDSIGQSVVFQYDVDWMRPGGTPVFTTNALLVPEPGTGVLLVIGLVGLALRQRR